MIATLNAAGLPALRIAGALFLVINFLAAAWLWRHRRQLFGPDSTAIGGSPVTGDRAHHSVALCYVSSALCMDRNLDFLTISPADLTIVVCEKNQDSLKFQA